MEQNSFQIVPSDAQAYFGPLYPYILDDGITDIDYNGRELWITNSRNERLQESETELTQEFVEQFTKRIANAVSKPFHRQSPILEAETDTLRITIVHESVCQGVRCFCIRKSLPRVRITWESAIESGYATEELLQLLRDCVKARMNFVFAGNPGVGKTECAKFFSSFIPGNERVITIEDNPEWHYSRINPGKDCIEFKINDAMDYTKAIKTCLRLNPTWMFLSEARSVEVKYLLEGFSTGVRGMTTLHTDDLRKIPDRIVNMIGESQQESRIQNDVYSFLDVGVLIKRREVIAPDGTRQVKRYIDQVCFYTREDGKNYCIMVVEDGAPLSENLMSLLPEEKLRKFRDAGILLNDMNSNENVEESDRIIDVEELRRRIAQEVTRKIGEEGKSYGKEIYL